MQAIILAAGMGKRLKDLTKNNTKCMVKVNGVTLIERMMYQLEQFHLSRIIIVVGYEGKKLIDYIETLNIFTPIQFITNPIYNKTNNIYSLALAKQFLLEEDTLLLESDLIFEDSVLWELLQDPRDTLALVDKYEAWMDGTVVKLDNDDSIQTFVPGKKFVFEDIPNYYKTVNIYKFSKHFSATHYVPFLEAYSKALGNNEYYEQVLRVIALLDEPIIKAKRLNGQSWYEIDDIQDLDIASSIFASNGEEKVRRLQQRFGGYWRYPKLLDFCYLVNPYYPSNKLVNELKANFETLLTQYPSGMNVNSLLAAKNFGIPNQCIMVGNGAAELIKIIMEDFNERVGFIKPTFDEYLNRYPEERSVIYEIQDENFSYNADELINFFNNKEIKMLVLVNPDNPSGNYIVKESLCQLALWCEKQKIILLLDESFVDFAEDINGSMLDINCLSQYPHMIVIKSISKSHGVPGLRLGVAASYNEKFISLLKKKVSIWNINSFGEFYMQIQEKYTDDYKNSLRLLIVSRNKMINSLHALKGIRVFPSEANYLMCEITNGMSAFELTEKLLEKKILIKDLGNKIKNGKQYIRIAVRSDEDNNKLVLAIKEIFEMRLMCKE